MGTIIALPTEESRAGRTLASPVKQQHWAGEQLLGLQLLGGSGGQVQSESPGAFGGRSGSQPLLGADGRL